MNARVNTTSRLLMLLAAFAAIALAMFYMASPVLAADKVTICHANSGAKEFVAITIDQGAATEPHLNNVNGSPLNGHADDFLLQGEQTAEDCFNAAHSASPSPSEAEQSIAESEAESVAESGEQSVSHSGEPTPGTSPRIGWRWAAANSRPTEASQ